VAEHHGRFDDKVSDAAFNPVVHVGAADAGPFGLDDDIVRGGEFGDGAVFVDNLSWGLENEGGILLWIRIEVFAMFILAVESFNRALLLRVVAARAVMAGLVG